MKNLKNKLHLFEMPLLKPFKPIVSSDDILKSTEYMYTQKQQKEGQSFYRFLMPFIVSIIVLILASLQVYHMYKSSSIKEKLLQQSNIINELSTKIISLEDQIKEIESSLSKTNKTIDR